MYSYDSCGNRGALVEQCSGGRSCMSSGTTASCECTPNAQTRCHAGGVYNYDSCGNRGGFVEQCFGGRVCVSSGTAAACACTPDAETRCDGDDVYNYDSCGSRGSLAEQCTGGQVCMSSGTTASCACTPNAETRCDGGDVYNYDSCGDRGSLAEQCSAGEVCTSNGTAAACGCTPNTETRCYSGDVYHYDSCGQRGSVAQACNMGCTQGMCIQGARRPFDQTCIMSDAVFSNLTAINRAAVQLFLEGRSGRLKERDLWQSVPFAHPGTLAYDWQYNDMSLARQSAPADVIYLSAIDQQSPPNRVNPQVLIAMLQKEQSLIDDPARATANVMDWAMGYGVPDSGNRDQAYRGFASQVLGTAFSLTQNFDAGPAMWPTLPPIDGVTIVPRSRATYALYKHTPHIHGNRLLYDLFWDYFGDPGQCTTSAAPTVTGLPNNPSVTVDAAIALSGVVRASGENLTRVTVAVTGPGISGSNTTMTMMVNAGTFDLNAFSFAPAALGLGTGTFGLGVWTVTESRAAELIGDFNVRVLPAASGSVFLAFPIAAHQADTAPINSVFDHAMTTAYAHDGRVVAFTGEEGRVVCGGDGTSRVTPGYFVYRNGDCRPGETFSVDDHYRYRNDPVDKYKLYYDDHPGYDFQASRGTQIRAPAAGTVRLSTYSNGNCPIVAIDHGNGYTSVFLHTATRIAGDGDQVAQGDAVATVGATCTGGAHLHYEVRKANQTQRGYHRVDPYGWQGTGAEPYTVDANMPRLWLSTAAIGGQAEPVCAGGCASGSICVGGECLFACSDALDCVAGEACLEGACTSVCYPVPVADCDPGVPFNPGDGSAEPIPEGLPAGPEDGSMAMADEPDPGDPSMPPEDDGERKPNSPWACYCRHSGPTGAGSAVWPLAMIALLAITRRRPTWAMSRRGPRAP